MRPSTPGSNLDKCAEVGQAGYRAGDALTDGEADGFATVRVEAA